MASIRSVYSPKRVKQKLSKGETILQIQRQLHLRDNRKFSPLLSRCEADGDASPTKTFYWLASLTDPPITTRTAVTEVQITLILTYKSGKEHLDAEGLTCCPFGDWRSSVPDLLRWWHYLRQLSWKRNNYLTTRCIPSYGT